MLEVVPEELAPGLVAAGRFRLERRLGGGGMGEVWAAVHEATGKRVALKFLKPSRAGDAKSHARLAQEARAACAVRHPNVAAIHDVGELESGLPFLVMDRLEGESLADKLAREGRLTPREAAALLVPVVDAARALHAAGVVHRDLKPANIFLETTPHGSSHVRVLDFGIAKVRDDGAAAGAPLTETGEMTGTSFYMAPEQVFAERDVDERADTWALGIILYELLTGAPPTKRASVGQVFKAITTDELTPLDAVDRSVPTPLARLVGRMMSRDRALRPGLPEVRDMLIAVRDGAASRRSPRFPVYAAGAAAVLAVGLGAWSRAPRPEAGVTAGGTSRAADRAVAAAPAAPPSIAADPVAASSRGGSPSTAASDPAAPAARARVAAPARPRATVDTNDAGSMPAPSASGIILTHDRK